MLYQQNDRNALPAAYRLGTMSLQHLICNFMPLNLNEFRVYLTISCTQIYIHTKVPSVRHSCVFVFHITPTGVPKSFKHDFFLWAPDLLVQIIGLTRRGGGEGLVNCDDLWECGGGGCTRKYDVHLLNWHCYITTEKNIPGDQRL